MFEWFDESARLAVVRAQEQARQLNHGWVGTEHLLLGVMAVGGSVSSRALTALGVGLDDARVNVETIIARGSQPVPVHVPFTPRVKKVFDLSVHEASQFTCQFVSDGHILLALLREGQGVAAIILRRHGIGMDQLHAQVSQLMATSPSPAGEAVRLRAEIERLRALLHAHDIDPAS